MGSPNFQTRSMNIKARVVFFLSFLATQNGEINVALSEGVWISRPESPQRPVDQRIDFPDQHERSTNIKVRVVVFFLSFLAIKNGEITIALSEGMSGLLPRFRWRAVRISIPDQQTKAQVVFFLSFFGDPSTALTFRISVNNLLM